MDFEEIFRQHVPWIALSDKNDDQTTNESSQTAIILNINYISPTLLFLTWDF